MAAGDIGYWTVPLAVFGGAIRISTPFLFVSLGECITERSGRINLGLEGTLVMGAMSAYGVSYLTGSPWLGVLAAGIAGALLGALHAAICSLPRVNDVAVGIAQPRGGYAIQRQLHCLAQRPGRHAQRLGPGIVDLQLQVGAL